MSILRLGFSDKRLRDTSVSSKLKIYRVFDRKSRFAFCTQSAVCSLQSAFYTDRGLFAVDDDGVLTVKKSLDHKKNSAHDITVAVHDLGETQLFAERPAQVYISLRDLNDNSPLFELSLYEKTISEGTPAGTPVLRVHAMVSMDADQSFADSEMAYLMAKINWEHDFNLNSSSGVIYVKNALDFERKKFYRFQVAVQGVSKS